MGQGQFTDEIAQLVVYHILLNLWEHSAFQALVAFPLCSLSNTSTSRLRLLPATIRGSSSGPVLAASTSCRRETLTYLVGFLRGLVDAPQQGSITASIAQGRLFQDGHFTVPATRHPKVNVNLRPPKSPWPVPFVPVETKSKGPVLPSEQVNVPRPSRLVT